MQNLIETLKDSWLAKMALLALALGAVPFYFLSMAVASLQG